MLAIDLNTGFGLVILILLAVWAVLMFFAPFFWYGSWYRAKQIHKQLEITNALLRRQQGEEPIPVAPEARSEPHTPSSFAGI